jgi:transcriptional regulator with XRE-family HTH domain
MVAPKRAAPKRARTTKTIPTPAGSEPGTSDITERVGEAVRALRKERGYSLEEMAALTGVSRATLSQIETNKTNPTVGVLWKISSGLGVPFSSLLGESPHDRIVVVRKNAQGLLQSDDGAFESRPLTPARSLGNVELYELTLAPRSKHDSAPHAPGTMEGIVVTAGVVRVGVAGDVRDAGVGDAIYFRADSPHFYENPGRVPAKVFNLIAYTRG